MQAVELAEHEYQGEYFETWDSFCHSQRSVPLSPPHSGSIKKKKVDNQDDVDDDDDDFDSYNGANRDWSSQTGKNIATKLVKENTCMPDRLESKLG